MGEEQRRAGVCGLDEAMAVDLVRRVVARLA